MSDKDDKISEQSEDGIKPIVIKKEKKRKKKNKSKKNKTKLEKKDSDDDVYDISPAKDRPWSPDMAQRETVVTAYKQIGSYNRFALSHGSVEESDEERQDKGRKGVRRDRTKAARRKENKSFDTYPVGRNNTDLPDSQRENEKEKLAGRRTVIGIGNPTVQRGRNGHVNMINVEPVHAGRELHYSGVPIGRNSSINNINGPVFRNIDGQSDEIGGATANLLPSLVGTNDIFNKDTEHALANDLDIRPKKKRKKKGKKKEKKKIQDESKKRIIVDPCMFQEENGQGNIAPKIKNKPNATRSTSQKDRLTLPFIKDIENDTENEVTQEDEIEKVAENESKTTNETQQNDALVSPIIEDIEDNIEHEFQANVEDEVIMAESSNDIKHDALILNDDRPATLSALNLSCDCRACIGEIDEPTTNNSERSDQPIGRFRKLLKFLTCCFTSKVED